MQNPKAQGFHCRILPSTLRINKYLYNVLLKKKERMHSFLMYLGFPGGSDGKAPACNVGDPDSIPGSGRSPGEGNGNPLQHSCLENPMDRGA